MRALVAASGGVQIREVDDPVPASDHALVEVKAVSLNRGECIALGSAEEGWRPGWDLAGVVVRPAADARGPADGARVVGWANGGAWAERVAVRADHLAEIPDSLSFQTASTLPVAGLTAVGVLSPIGSLLGRRVAITGAAGGVGRFAVQLAEMAGATVTAIVGRPERGEGLRELGADEIVVGLEREGPEFDLIADSVGGDSLSAAVSRVGPDGIIVSFGNSSNEPARFDPRTFYRKGSARMLGYFVVYELLRGRIGTARLAALSALVAEGRLVSSIDLEVPWTEAASAIDALMQRRVNGKAVMVISAP